MPGILILAVLAVFIAVVAIRTIRFVPKPKPEVSDDTVSLEVSG